MPHVARAQRTVRRSDGRARPRRSTCAARTGSCRTGCATCQPPRRTSYRCTARGPESARGGDLRTACRRTSAGPRPARDRGRARAPGDPSDGASAEEDGLLELRVLFEDGSACSKECNDPEVSGRHMKTVYKINKIQYCIQYTIYNKAGRLRYDETGGRDLASRTQPAAEAL